MKNLLFTGVMLLITSAQAHDAIFEKITPYLPTSPIVIEAGVHNGSDTLYMSKKWPNGIIYGFEPVPDLFQQALTRNNDRHNVFLFNTALSNKKGVSRFFCSGPYPFTGSGSLLKPTGHLSVHPQVQFNTTINVETIILDEWAQDNKITHVDLMWLDMQGAEYAVLQAAPITTSTAKVIVVEVNYAEMYENCGLFNDLSNLLKGYGFILLENIEVMQGAWGDAIFIKQ